MEYLEGLNPAQKEAVLYKDGPLLILAGAGAGKTKTITHRILNIIREGAAPNQVLAITFTNKAAKEMKDRVDKLLESDKEFNFPINSHERPFMSTFHSLGVHILKENSRHIDLPRHFTIFDRTDSKRAVKEAIEEIGLDPKQFEPSKILAAISREKGNLKTAESYRESVRNDYFPKIVSEVWLRYEAIMKKEKAMDFDDLLLKTVILLRNKPEILEHYQNAWKYIHIDEYQDTNKVQYTISKLLAAKNRNICVVGDVDQNIYSWRGADIQNILNFEEDYPEAKVILLEENYRSTQTILTAANRIIEKNKMRREKKLFTKNIEGEKIGIYAGYDEIEEAEFIAEKAEELVKRGISPEEISILYRANFQSRVLEEALLRYNLPYQVLGTRFFDRKEVKDVLSYLKAALNPDCLSDIKRIINVPVRGIGKVTMLRIFSGKKDELPPAMLKKVDDFFTTLGAIKTASTIQKPSELIKFIMKISGIEDSLKKSATEEELERLENIKELVTLATKYDHLSPEEGLESLITDAALATDQDSLIKSQQAIKLMTIHASKGLEFDYVFITGLEENLFPHKRMNEDASTQDLEEERRLFYVALTRARKKIFLTYAGMRTIFGSKQINMPSEFMIEMDDDLTQAEEKKGDRKLGIKTIYFD